MQNAVTSNARHASLGDEWLTPLQVAHEMGYRTDKTIMKAIKAGELRAYERPCGRGLRVRATDLERWVESLRYRPDASALSTSPQRKKRHQTKALDYARTHERAA